MAFTVQNLIEGRSKPIVARPDQSLDAVLTTMLEHGYSQLPIVDPDDHPCQCCRSAGSGCDDEKSA
jgi:CBS domain-containing protein